MIHLSDHPPRACAARFWAAASRGRSEHICRSAAGHCSTACQLGMPAGIFSTSTCWYHLLSFPCCWQRAPCMSWHQTPGAAPRPPNLTVSSAVPSMLSCCLPPAACCPLKHLHAAYWPPNPERLSCCSSLLAALAAGLSRRCHLRKPGCHWPSLSWSQLVTCAGPACGSSCPPQTQTGLWPCAPLPCCWARRTGPGSRRCAGPAALLRACPRGCPWLELIASVLPAGQQHTMDHSQLRPQGGCSCIRWGNTGMTSCAELAGQPVAVGNVAVGAMWQWVL